MLKLPHVPIVLLAASTALSAQTFTVLYNFGDNPGDPTTPYNTGALAQSRGGAIFSSNDSLFTDLNGGAYRITPSGTFTVVHRFNRPGGRAPVGGLTLATDGQFYGTNALGGLYGYGNVFKMKQGGGLTVLHVFDGTGGCTASQAPPIQSVHGEFYGTSVGDYTHPGCVYRVTKSGEYTVLHSFSGPDGANPYAPLVQGSDFYFYGTASYGGAHGYGTIFRISAAGDFRVLYSFDGIHGKYPWTPLIQANDGNFYGVTSIGGSTQGGGVLFRMTPGGNVTVLHNFTGGKDGQNLVGGLVQATDGNLYGVDNMGAAGCGVVFRIALGGEFTTMHTFDGGHGCQPQAGMLQHTNGILYGTTALGGNSDLGTFYSLDAGLPPFVTYLPTYDRPGAVVRILGQGFTADSVVSFNGTPADSPVVIYPTYLKAVVPAGATTGPITVTSDSGTLTSNKVFVVHSN